jgi:hypothetical protein
MSRKFWAAIVVAAGVGLAAGCGGSGSGPKSVVALDAGGKAALEDLGPALKSLAEEGRKPPGKLAEFDAVEPMVPVAGPAIRSGDIVYLWGSGYATGSTQVVAYEKKVPAEGGYVLLQDGTVKEMSAAEFKAAPKTKGK